MNKTITSERLQELEDIEFQMQCLENGGVDNWEWYSESLIPWCELEEKREKEKEKIKLIGEAFSEVLESLSESTYEPSEIGAGFAFTEESENNAKNIFIRLIDEFTNTKKDEVSE